jgi:hypothetical protein
LMVMLGIAPNATRLGGSRSGRIRSSKTSIPCEGKGEESGSASYETLLTPGPRYDSRHE